MKLWLSYFPAQVLIKHKSKIACDRCGKVLIFRFQFYKAYGSAYNSDFRFSLGHKRSYESVASENQPFDYA